MKKSIRIITLVAVIFVIFAMLVSCGASKEASDSYSPEIGATGNSAPSKDNMSAENVNEAKRIVHNHCTSI